MAWQESSGASGLPRDPGARERAQAALREAEATAEAHLAPDPAPQAQPLTDQATPHAQSAAQQPARQPAPQAQSPTGRTAPHAQPPTQARPSAPLRQTSQSPQTPRSAAAPSKPTAPQHPLIPAHALLDELPDNLDALRDAVRDCQKCELCKTRQNTVFSRGTGSSGICFVGEGPGADEDASGQPFVGKAGQLLDKMIAAMGLERDEIYICNILKCRPPDNRKPTPQEMGTCSPYLHRQLQLLQPRVIIALGATAVEGLLGASGGITRMRGTFRLYNGHIAVMPTFHPAYLLRSPGAKREVWSDLKQVLHHLGRELPARD